MMMRLTMDMMIRKMRINYPGSVSSEYDDENPDDEKDEVESYDSEINEIIPDDELDEEDVDLGEDDDEYSDEEVVDE